MNYKPNHKPNQVTTKISSRICIYKITDIAV